MSSVKSAVWGSEDLAFSIYTSQFKMLFRFKGWKNTCC